MSELRCLAAVALLLLCVRSPLTSVVEVDRGLGGRLLTRVLPLGGGGKLPMLLVLRTVLPGVGIAEDGDAAELWVEAEVLSVLSVGTAGVDCVLAVLGVGRPVVVTARARGLIPDIEPDEGGRVSETSGASTKDFRVFATGRAGRGPDGGGEIGGGALVDGRCGMAEVMVAVVVVDIQCSDIDAAAFRNGKLIYGSVLVLLTRIRIVGSLGVFTCSVGRSSHGLLSKSSVAPIRLVGSRYC